MDIIVGSRGPQMPHVEVPYLGDDGSSFPSQKEFNLDSEYSFWGYSELREALARGESEIILDTQIYNPDAMKFLPQTSIFCSSVIRRLRYFINTKGLVAGFRLG